MLKKRLEDWMEKVLDAYTFDGGVDTYHIIVDVDKIIAEAFNHDPVLPENE